MSGRIQRFADEVRGGPQEWVELSHPPATYSSVHHYKRNHPDITWHTFVDKGRRRVLAQRRSTPAPLPPPTGVQWQPHWPPPRTSDTEYQTADDINKNTAAWQRMLDDCGAPR